MKMKMVRPIIHKNNKVNKNDKKIENDGEDDKKLDEDD